MTDDDFKPNGWRHSLQPDGTWLTEPVRIEISMPDPTMPKAMSERVRRELAELLAWNRVQPAPIDFYRRIYDALIADALDPMPEPGRDTKREAWHRTPGGTR